MDKQYISVAKQQQNAEISWQGVLAFGTNVTVLPAKKQVQQMDSSSFIVLP